MRSVRRQATTAIVGAALAASLSFGVLADRKRSAEPAARHAPDASPREATRPPFGLADQAAAEVPHFSGVRFFGDSVADFLRALPERPGPWLILSAGGADGAFGAGVLKGWSEAGTRPDFTVVTGVSTGALMAPYAFAGRRYDEDLRATYTQINAGDVFEAGPTKESLVDSWPLAELIAKRVTPQLLADVAAEHRRGRRLFVQTTNLDAGRPVVWNMGAIAARGDAEALALFRKVLLASAAIPGLFPPVYIEAAANGHRFLEMHADGSASAPLLVAPAALMADSDERRLPVTALYVVANTKLGPEFAVVDRSLAAIFGRAVASALKAGLALNIELAARMATRIGVPMHLAEIPADFERPSRGAFDPDYMSALFRLGERRARRDLAFRTLDGSAAVAARERPGGATSGMATEDGGAGDVTGRRR
jgi:hypothetical protein